MTNSTTVKSRKHEDVEGVVKKQVKTQKTARVGKTRQALGLRLWRSWETPSKPRRKSSTDAKPKKGTRR